MFRWYKHAEVCYAYLEDVEAGTELDFDSDIPHSITTISEESLAAARWFTRGWTLQEMIASRTLRFYASGWIYLGTKYSLRKQLTRITGVNRYGLFQFMPQDFSVAQRMSWAAYRKTTRTEDIAYSLMFVSSSA
jgi:hypothetical protein